MDCLTQKLARTYIGLLQQTAASLSAAGKLDAATARYISQLVGRISNGTAKGHHLTEARNLARLTA